MINDPKPMNPVEEVAILLREIRDVLKGKATDEMLYYDNADLKRMLNVSDSTLYRMRKANVIPYRKIRGKIFYPKAYFVDIFKK